MLFRSGSSRCEVNPGTEDPFPIYCPAKCVDSKVSARVAPKEKDAFLESEGSRIRQMIQKKLPSTLMESVSKQFPGWVPVLFLRRSAHVLKLEGAITGLSAEFAVGDQAKKKSCHDLLCKYPGSGFRDSYDRI